MLLDSSVQIVIHPEETSHIQATDSAIFTCVAYGNPPPFITWRRNGSSEVTSNSRVNISEKVVSLREITFVKSVLEICSSEEGDSGEYSCDADNGARSDGFRFDFTVIPESKQLLIINSHR